MQYFLRFILISLLAFFGYISSGNAFTVFIPGANISLTGANNGVFFDVADDLFGYPTTPPHLSTAGRSFSGSFYLTGAGWIEFDTGSYRVDFDCGAQSLANITIPCTLSGTAWSETIGDVSFDKKVLYYPTSGTLSGSILTHIGTVYFSGIYLPIFPAEFNEGILSQANHHTALTLSGKTRFGDGGWSILMTPFGFPAFSRSYTDSTISAVDLSHAGGYSVMITDPNGSSSMFFYDVLPNVPSSILDPAVTTSLHSDFCMANAGDVLRCPDGATLHPMNLKQFGSNLVADGQDYYNFDFSVRDRYGNPVNRGKIQVEYTDTIRDIQLIPGDSEFSFASNGSGFALVASGLILNYFDGTPKFSSPQDLSVTSDLNYGFAAIAPTDTTNTLSLSGITYTDMLGNVSSIPDASIGMPLIFRPWYITSLTTSGDIVIGTEVPFTTYFTNQSSVSNITASPIYGLTIGSTMNAYFANLMSTPSASCRQEAYTSDLDECNWGHLAGSNIPTAISTTAPSFTGTYFAIAPNQESIAYSTYITYTVGGTRILYPSAQGNLGTSKYSQSSVKILGQNNLGNTYFGLDTSADVRNDFWNMVRKNVALLSRNRTIYTDVDYDIIRDHDISIDATAFATKRTIVVIGGDVTITGDIPLDPDKALSVITLSNATGSGGNITIDPVVRDVHVSLFAEKSLFSHGDNQLYIYGSLLSQNTMGKSILGICPYYVNSCTNPESYDLEKIRKNYMLLPVTAGHMASSPRALEHPKNSLIIEYDGRILTDPPLILQK